MLSIFTKKNVMVFENQNSNEEQTKNHRESEQGMERIDVNSNTVRTEQQHVEEASEEYFDEVDGRSTQDRLGDVARVCTAFAGQLQTDKKEYSKKNFKSVSSKLVLRKTYKSPLEFEVFEEPANIDPENDPRYLLASKRIIYDVLGNIFFKISDASIEDVRTTLVNVVEPLDGVIPRLDVSSYTWQPKTQTMADLEQVVDSLPDKDWPICKEAGLTRAEKRQKLINLTLIKHLEQLMINLGNSAKILQNRH